MAECRHLSQHFTDLRSLLKLFIARIDISLSLRRICLFHTFAIMFTTFLHYLLQHNFSSHSCPMQFSQQSPSFFDRCGWIVTFSAPALLNTLFNSLSIFCNFVCIVSGVSVEFWRTPICMKMSNLSGHLRNTCRWRQFTFSYWKMRDFVLYGVLKGRTFETPCRDNFYLRGEFFLEFLNIEIAGYVHKNIG